MANQLEDSPADILAVQFIPFGEVITLFVPEPDRATNSPSSGDQQTQRQPFNSVADVLPVQVIPSLEVATLFVPSRARATNNLSSLDQHTQTHKLVILDL